MEEFERVACKAAEGKLAAKWAGLMLDGTGLALRRFLVCSGRILGGIWVSFAEPAERRDPESARASRRRTAAMNWGKRRGVVTAAVLSAWRPKILAPAPGGARGAFLCLLYRRGEGRFRKEFVKLLI
jgi:hypothetical protein